MTSLKVRSTAVLGTAALALSWFGTGAAPSATPPMTPVAAVTVTDKAHPFSDPVWWPLRTPSVVDCTKMNDCRSGPHSFWGIDVLSKPAAKGNDNYIKDAGVFSMGAGIAHIGDAKGRDCPEAGEPAYASTTFGKWVWVDHGGGVVSKYGHLSRISVKEGQLVTPDTRLGTVGNTGIKTPGSCHIHYVDFLTKYPGIRGESKEFSRSSVGRPDGRLLACSTKGELQVWPDDLTLRDEPTRMELVHSREVLPATGNGCRKNAVPKTANKPSGVKLATAGSGALKASWTKSPSSVDKVRLELSEYHPSTPGWDDQKNSLWKDVSARYTSGTFKDLTHKKRWRVRVWFHTKAGWSVGSSWVERTTT